MRSTSPSRPRDRGMLAMAQKPVARRPVARRPVAQRPVAPSPGVAGSARRPACRLRGLVVGEPAVAHARQPHNVHARREAVPQPVSHEARRRVLHMAMSDRAPQRVHEVVVLDRAPRQSTGIGPLHARAHGGDQAEPQRLTARRGHRNGWGCRSYGDHGQKCPPS